MLGILKVHFGVFQSTLPVWGATCTLLRSIPGSSDFNPRSPCGERHRHRTSSLTLNIFQSTLPVWGATHERAFQNTFESISIHAPRVGSDTATTNFSLRNLDFNPRSPCGERQKCVGQ